MAVKLSSLLFLRTIPKRVSLNASFYSISCANAVNIDPETYQNTPISSEFESKIQFLRDKLHLESMVHVPDSTTDINSSLTLFKWASIQKKFKPNVDTYYLTILKLGTAGYVEEMESFCNEMVKENCAGFDGILLALIDNFVENDKLDEALRVFSCMNSSSIKPSIRVINGLMGALVKAKKDFKDVLFVYKEMVKVGILPNVETLNYLLEALLEADRVDTALHQYRRMNKKGCSPNSRTFEVLISGLIAKERVDESLLLLDEMLEIGCEVDVRFYDRIIPLFCWMNKYVVGLRLVTRMKTSKISPDSSTYAAMIQCLCRNLYMDDAISLFEEMIDDGVTPDTDIYMDVVSGLCKMNKFSEAQKILVDNNVDISCPYNLLLGEYCKDGNLVAAKYLFDKMFDRSLTDSLSWNFLIASLCDTGRVEKALEVLGRMIVFSFVPDSTTCSALIMGKCKQNELKDALLLFDQIKEKCQVLESASYDELVKCLAQKDKIAEAAEVFSYMSTKQIPLQSSTFDLLIKVLCAIGEVNFAIRLLSLAHCSGTHYSSATYNSIMQGLLKFGKMDGLLVMLSRMVVNGHPIEEDTYCIFMQCLSATDNPKDCAKFFNVMLNKGLLPDSETVTCALSCLSKDSKLHMILGTIDKLMFYPDVLDSNMYNMLISGWCKEGYRGAASHLLDTMLGKGWIPNAETHRLLVGPVVYEKSGTQTPVSETLGCEDEVSSILADALAQT